MTIRNFPGTDAGTWIRWVSQVVVIPLLAYGFWQMTHIDGKLSQHVIEAAESKGRIEGRLSVIESNRFTSRDAAKLQFTITQKDAELLALINEVRTKNSVQDERIRELIEDVIAIREGAR